MDYSVIVPVYNCKAYLTACVESICRGLPEGSQILLIDDGSTDGSGVLCDALAKRFSNITVLHQENRGAAAARNAGLREASGEYILFVDADDRLDSELLGRMLRDFSQSDADMGLFGLTYDYYYRGSCYRSDRFLPPRQGFAERTLWASELDMLFRQELLSPLWNKIFRRDNILRHCLFLREDMTVYEDLEFVLRYLAVCGSIFYEQVSVYHYRQAEDEGNAGRRLGAASSLWGCIAPVAAAIAPFSSTDLLHRLYLILAREKIALSDRADIRRVCREYGEHFPAKAQIPEGFSVFAGQLRQQKVTVLQWCAAKTAIRHRIAVWAKAAFQRRTSL